MILVQSTCGGNSAGEASEDFTGICEVYFPGMEKSQETFLAYLLRSCFTQLHRTLRLFTSAFPPLGLFA
jgi:hypothetical protein